MCQGWAVLLLHCCRHGVLWKGARSLKLDKLQATSALLYPLRWNRRDCRAALHDLFICAMWNQGAELAPLPAPAICTFGCWCSRLVLWGEHNNEYCTVTVHGTYRRCQQNERLFKVATYFTFLTPSWHMHKKKVPHEPVVSRVCTMFYCTSVSDVLRLRNKSQTAPQP